MCEYREKFLTLDNMDPCIKKMHFIEGLVAKRATEIEKELAKTSNKLFTEVINAHYADCHALGQKPLTYIRQVIALVLYPELFDDPRFLIDVKNKAQTILNGCRNRSIGSYSDSPGMETVRLRIAKYIEERDGIASCWKNIVCGNGATDLIRLVLNLFPAAEGEENSGIMIPVPQYPLYSACITEFKLHRMEYYLDEGKSWAVDIADLDRAVNEGRECCRPRAIVVTNPGNPTGQVLTKENLENLIKFAHKENLFILADEVHQENILAPECEFLSMKKVMMEMGAPYHSVQLASFMSGSKGFIGEGGYRAGCVELTNVDLEVTAMLVKSIASATCPSVLGQAVMYCVTDRPKPGEPSFNVYDEERSTILERLKLNALMTREKLNCIPGFSCQPVQGAMYAFPSIEMPPRAVLVAKGKYQDASELYAMELLEDTGVCVTPGCYFGQRPDAYHFRATILLKPDMLSEMLNKIRAFHLKFLAKYS